MASADPLDGDILSAWTAVAPDADLGAIDPDRPWRDQIEVDSVDFLNFALKLQARFSLTITELDFPMLTSLAGCRAFLRAAGVQGP